MSDKQPPMANATVATQVDLKPQGSQTLLVALVVLAGLCLVLGAGLLSLGKNAGWAFVILALPLACIAAKGWFAAHSDADLNDAKVTTFSAGGLTVSTDSRTLRNTAASEALGKLIETGLRQKLPTADGIIENGVLVPDSAEAAAIRVKQINDVVEDHARNLEDLLNRKSDGPTVTQRPVETLVPPAGAKPQLNVSAPGEQAPT